MATLRQREHHRHPIDVFEDVGALRRAVAGLAAKQSGLRRGEAELVATELATNLWRHADPGGYVLYRQTCEGVELLSVDTGPGIVSRHAHGIRGPAMPAAGTLGPPVSGAGGLSAGLAGVRRMATDFDYYSTAAGAVLLARLGGTHAGSVGRWRYGAVNVPLGGAGTSGDAWAVTTGLRPAALVVDGLGHGDEAATAAQAAVTVFEQQPVTDPADFLRRAHEAMRTTRGGVAGLCVMDPRNNQMTYAGIGNIAAQVVHRGDKQHLVSHGGTLGTHLAAPRVHVQQCSWPPGATLVMTSDGINAGWDLSAYPGLLGHDPTVIAAVLHRDFTRSTDDAAVLVLRDMS